MAAPPTSTKWKKKAGPTKGERLSTNKTAAIAKSQAATKAQTAPGTDYKATRAARKAAEAAAPRAAGGGGGETEAEKRKARMAKMASFTAEIKAKRKARSSMPTFGR